MPPLVPPVPLVPLGRFVSEPLGRLVSEPLGAVVSEPLPDEPGRDDEPVPLGLFMGPMPPEFDPLEPVLGLPVVVSLPVDPGADVPDDPLPVPACATVMRCCWSTPVPAGAVAVDIVNARNKVVIIVSSWP